MNALKYIPLIASSILLLSCNEKNETYDASGTFEATEIMISSEASGRLLAFDIQEGQTLEANQLVGYIDSTQLYLRKKQLMASVKAIESRRPDTKRQIAVFEQQLTTLNSEKQRFQNLLQGNAANQKQIDDINAQIALVTKQLEAQKSTLSITTKNVTDEASTVEVQMEQIEDQLQKCKIINPMSGTVLVKYTELNELCMPGKALYKIADIENMTLRAYVTSDQLTQLKIGQTVKIFADFGKDKREYPGTINWISSKSEFTPKTIQTKNERDNLVYAVKISVKNDGFLKIGMYGDVKWTMDN